MRKKITPVLLSMLIITLFCIPVYSAGEKFMRVYKDSKFDLYVNTATIIQNQGVMSFWTKSIYSDNGKSDVKKELPAKYKNAAIEYGMDYFVFNSKKGKYNIKMCSIYSGGKEIYREGNKKWLPLNNGTVAKVVVDKVNEYIKQKNIEKESD